MSDDFCFDFTVEQTSRYPDIRDASERIGHRRTALGTKIGTKPRNLNPGRDMFLAHKPPKTLLFDNGGGV